MAFQDQCFINCPFDKPYRKKMLKPLLFTILHFNLNPVICENPHNRARLDHIMHLMKNSKYGIHDISRMDLSKSTNLPRFNMPYELGIDFGLRNSGDPVLATKIIYVMEKEPYRYIKSISDINGFDPVHHKNKAEDLTKNLRNVLYNTLQPPVVKSGSDIWKDFIKSTSDIRAHLTTYSDDDWLTMPATEYVKYTTDWITGGIPHIV
jgi:hypothetical protein